MRCFGCGALVSVSDAAAHRYLGTAPGCWQLFCEVLAREFGPFGYPPVHRLTVDAYAVQHVGEPGPRTIRSAALHLVGLCLSLEHAMPPERVTEAIGRVRNCGIALCWLDPPVPPGQITIVDVHAAADLQEHTRIVKRWAAGVWQAWAQHHATVHALIGSIELGGRTARGRP